ncbi:MAG: TetR/AcrR family transcriptional regulator [Candidatus Binatia bacterium]
MNAAAKHSSPAGERSTTLERILAVATRLFAERGYGMTSMRDIARAARLRAATLYHYFPSKDDLYLEVLDREQAKMRSLMNEVLSEETEFPKQIGKMVARAFDYHLKNPTLAKLGLRAALGDGLRRPYDQRWLGMMEMLLRPRAAKGEIKELDPALFLITAGAIITQHAIANGAYRDLVGNRMSAEEADARTREHVQQIFLRCLGLDEPPKEPSV